MVPEIPDRSEDKVPLVLDVDGTLLKTDLLYECFWAGLGEDAPATLGTTVRNAGAPARLKAELTAIATPNVALLPVRDSILERAVAAQRDGRPVHLVSGADQALVDALATRLDLPGPHFGSKDGRNLTGTAKAGFLQERFGSGGYDYAGNGAQDLPAWAQAREMIAVAPPPEVRRGLAGIDKPLEIVGTRWTARELLRELRPHQWVKNLLLFLPLLAAHHFDADAFARVALTFAAFSLGASATYILNDLLDLEADRRHPEKRHRPVASGRLPIPVAMVTSVVLMLIALTLALAVGPPVAALTLFYMSGSLSYSLYFKKLKWLDLLVLASLYLLRLVTGAVAAGVHLPPILLALCFAVFFALACAKRMTALTRLQGHGALPGRGYAASDLKTLEQAAYLAILAVALLYLAYAFGPSAAGLYDTRVLLALAGVPLVVWLFRIVRLSTQGLEDYDPVRFVLSDRTGFVILLAGAALVALAA